MDFSAPYFSTVRWCDVEMRYGMFRYKIYEVLWEVNELFHNKFGHDIELRSDLFRHSNIIYFKAIATNEKLWINS